MFYDLSWIDVPWGFGVWNVKSQLRGLSDILKSLRIQVSATILQLVFNTVDIPEIIRSFLSPF